MPTPPSCPPLQDTIITVNNLALLLEAKADAKGDGAGQGSEADLMFRRALPFTPRDMTA